MSKRVAQLAVFPVDSRDRQTKTDWMIEWNMFVTSPMSNASKRILTDNSGIPAKNGWIWLTG